MIPILLNWIVTILVVIGFGTIAVWAIGFITTVGTEARENKKQIEFGMFIAAALAVLVGIGGIIFSAQQTDQLASRVKILEERMALPTNQAPSVLAE